MEKIPGVYFAGAPTAQKELFRLMQAFEKQNLEAAKILLQKLLDRANTGELPEVTINYESFVPGVALEATIKTGWSSS